MDNTENIIDSLSDGVEILQKSLQCAICLELLKNPVCTRCSHSFCRTCIMTVVNSNRIAHCPLCNKSINRRSISENKKIAVLVEKVQNIIDGIGKDTGFDVTSHVKLPSSTREAFFASPKCQLKKQEITQIKVSPKKICRPTVTTSKEQWLKRYEKQYPGKRNSDDDADLLSISQAEPILPSYLAMDKKLDTVKNKVDKLKVPPVEKVQEWLQKNNEFDDIEEPVSATPESQQQQSHKLTVTADIHTDQDDYLSVSQTKQRFYEAPKKVDIGTLRTSSDESNETSKLKKIFTSLNDIRNITKLDGAVTKRPRTENTEGDPYEFISSQKSTNLPKKKKQRRSKTLDKKTGIKDVIKSYRPTIKNCSKKLSIKKDKLCSFKKPDSPPPLTQSDITFLCPVEMNDTFDNLVANVRKTEPVKPTKPIADKVDTGSDEEDDEIALFRTPLEAPIIYHKHDESTTESMSDIDFSSGSDEEWGKSNKVNQVPPQKYVKRRRSDSHGSNQPVKSNATTDRRTRSQSVGRCTRKSLRREKESQNRDLEVVQHDFEAVKEPGLLTNAPLSPTKKLNLNLEATSRTKVATNFSTDAALSGKENVCSVLEKRGDKEKTILDQTSAMNMTIASRSPGWSRISKSKKDFEKFKKPVLKALNVSGGEACVPKKHVTSSEIPKKVEVNKDEMSPLPKIDDADSTIDIPVVAFDSPKSLERVKMMTKIVMDLESQIGSHSPTINKAVTPKQKTPQIMRTPTLNKFGSFNSFSEPGIVLESPASCERNKQISTILSSLESECEQFVSGFKKCDGNVDSKKISDKEHELLNTLSTEIDICKRVIQESDNTMVCEEVQDNVKQNPEKDQSVISSREDHIQNSTEIVPMDIVPPETQNNQIKMFLGEVQNCNIDTEHFSAVANTNNETVSTSAVLPKLSNSIATTLSLNIAQKKQDCVLLTESEISTSEQLPATGDSMTGDMAIKEPESFILNNIETSCIMKPESSTLNNIETSSIMKPLTIIDSSVNNSKGLDMVVRSNLPKEFQPLFNGALDQLNVHHEETHIPFIKCGRLKYAKRVTKFVLLGSLIPYRKDLQPEKFSECISIVNSELKADTVEKSLLNENHEIGIQTSPKLIHSLRYGSDVSDTRVQTTSSMNSEFRQFTTPVNIIADTQEQNENFVPDSCGSMYMYPSAIPLPQYTVQSQCHVDSKKAEVPCLLSPVCKLSEPIYINKTLGNDEQEESMDDDVDLNETIVIQNPSKYSKPIGGYNEHGISCSQFSTATTIKIHNKISENENHVSKNSPELSSNSATQSELSMSLLQKPKDHVDHQSDIYTNQETVCNSQGRNLNNEKKITEINEQIEMTEPIRETVTEQISKNLNCKPDFDTQSNVTCIEKNNRRSSRVSRQLKFSPNVPKLSDPASDKNMDNMERDVQNLRKRSVKRMRVKNDSLDSTSSHVESEDTSDLELRNIKKPRRTSLKKASAQTKDDDDENIESSTKDTEVLNLPTPVNDENIGSNTKETEVVNLLTPVNDENIGSNNKETEVVNLLTPPEEASESVIPATDPPEEASESVIPATDPPEEASESVIPATDDNDGIEGKWLGSEVPDSEELMARVMANIEADLAETRKRKLIEVVTEDLESNKNKRRESPTLFTPPQVNTESEEQCSKMTCELIDSEMEAECEKPIKENCIGHSTTVGNDTEGLGAQQINDIQANILTLQTGVKECKAELQNVNKSNPISNVHPITVCDNSENESEDDFVEPTPKKEVSLNKTWECKSKEVNKMEIKDIVNFQPLEQGKSTAPVSSEQNGEQMTVLHNIQSNHGISAEVQCKQIEASMCKNPVLQSNKDSSMQPSSESKRFVIRLPEKNSPSVLPLARGEKVTTPKSLVPTNNSDTRSVTPRNVQKQPVDQVTALPSSTVEQPSTQMRLKTPKLSSPTRQLSFVCSGLPAGLIARVKALSKMLGAEFSNKVESHTTHLVVKASNDKLTDKTYKYLLAVVRRKWIVSIAWVNACLQARKFVPEDEYEMFDSSGENGPHRSRMASDPLFTNFEFCCIKPFTDLTDDQLEGMVQECGAVIVTKPEKFSFKEGHYCMILVRMDVEREQECKEWWEKYGVLSVGHEWVFECIGRYRIVPIWSFLMCTVSEEHVRALGFPDDAVLSDDETEVESEM